jgi:apolipoprotein N-acyltransferase
MSERAGPLILAVASGLLLFSAFPPIDLGFLGWVALVPLLLVLHGRSPQRAGALGAVAGVVAFTALMAWLRVFGVLAWVLVAAYLGAFVALFALLYQWISAGRGPAVEVWTAPVVWTALEYLRSIGVFGFPWALLGLTQHAYLPVLQAARYTGVFGVSFVLVLASSTIAALLRSRRLLPALLPAVLVAGVIGWGNVAAQRRVPGAVLPVAAVQPNVNPRQKFDPLLASAHMRTLRSLVLQAGRRGAHLIVLPETAIPFDLFGPQGVLREVGGWASGARATLIATSLEGGRSNIAVAVAPSGEALSRYDKVRLVAFGEYGLTPGSRLDPLRTPSGRVGIAVCFESIFPHVSRTLVRNGAEVLAVITNDGWFDGTAGVEQHAAHSVLRAVETGRWVVRAANTGLTMVIDPKGRVRGTVPLRTPRILTAQVGRVRLDTFYTRRGDVFSQGVLVVLLGLFLLPLRGGLRAELRAPAFQFAAITSALPFISVYLLLGTRAAWAWPMLLFAYLILFSRLHSPAAWGVTLRGMVPAILWGLAAVVVLWTGLALAFRAYDLPVEIPVPPGGWVTGVIAQLIVAAAAEVWLRGVAYTSIAQWKGAGTAAAAATALGVLIYRGLSAEAMAWALVTGAIFSVIRMRTGNAIGLVVPHALGNILFSTVALLR